MWKCRCLSSCLSQVIPSSVENQPGSSLRTEGLIPSFWKELREEDGLSAVHPMGKLFLRLLPKEQLGLCQVLETSCRGDCPGVPARLHGPVGGWVVWIPQCCTVGFSCAGGDLQGSWEPLSL